MVAGYEVVDGRDYPCEGLKSLDSIKLDRKLSVYNKVGKKEGDAPVHAGIGYDNGIWKLVIGDSSVKPIVLQSPLAKRNNF